MVGSPPSITIIKSKTRGSIDAVGWTALVYGAGGSHEECENELSKGQEGAVHLWWVPWMDGCRDMRYDVSWVGGARHYWLESMRTITGPCRAGLTYIQRIRGPRI